MLGDALCAHRSVSLGQASVSRCAFLVAQIQCHNYQSVNQSMDISDHSPVFCTFNVLVSGQGHVPQPVWVGLVDGNGDCPFVVISVALLLLLLCRLLRTPPTLHQVLGSTAHAFSQRDCVAMFSLHRP
jgi:hypothetical protein